MQRDSQRWIVICLLRHPHSTTLTQPCLGFVIPYTHQGQERGYIPDFIARLDDGHGPDDLLNLIVEVSGAAKADKAAKVATARTLWVPAVNNHAGYGRWAFIEVSDPWDAGHTIRASIGSQPVESP